MAEDEADETPRKRRKVPPPGFMMGRALGQLKRASPDIYNELNEYAKATGKRPTRVMRDALEHYILRRRVIQSEMTVEQLYEAFLLVGEFQAQAVRLFLDWAKLMFSEEYKSMLELRAEMAPPPPKPQKIEDLEQRVMEKTWSIIEPLLDWTVESMMKAMMPYMVGKPPQLKGTKIPVTIIEEPEDEEKVPIPIANPTEEKKKTKKKKESIKSRTV